MTRATRARRATDEALVQVAHEVACEPGVSAGGERDEPGLRPGADVEALDERPKLFGADAAATGELLQHRVRVGDRAASGRDLRANDGLDRLAQDLPVRVEVLRQFR